MRAAHNSLFDTIQSTAGQCTNPRSPSSQRSSPPFVANPLRASNPRLIANPPFTARQPKVSKRLSNGWGPMPAYQDRRTRTRPRVPLRSADACLYCLSRPPPVQAGRPLLPPRRRITQTHACDIFLYCLFGLGRLVLAALVAHSAPGWVSVRGLRVLFAEVYQLQRESNEGILCAWLQILRHG